MGTDMLRLAFRDAIRLRRLKQERDAWMYAALAAACIICLLILHAHA